MKILIASHNLTEEKCHLMPWRTLCEVTRRAREMGYDADLVSLGATRGPIAHNRLPTGTVEIRKDHRFLARDLRDLLANRKPDLIYWPVAWREPRRRTKILVRFGIPVVGYLPGGCYYLGETLYAARRIGLRAALPYLLEAVSSKSRQLAILRRSGFKGLIAMTEGTASQAISAGWAKDRVVAIPPGKEGEPPSPGGTLPGAVESWRQDRPFVLFAGPPSGIRGIFELLEAFDLAAERNPRLCLVCAFRSDGKLDSAEIRRVIARLRHPDRVLAVWESLSKGGLDALVSASRAVILPFVLVPSEIPLAIIETMALGKPVITTDCVGTGGFVARFGGVVPLGNKERLAEALVDLVSDERQYAEQCARARSLYMEHPTWDQVARSWLDFGRKARA